MKIIQVVHSFDPSAGGIESAVYSLSMELARQGHDVTVITTKEKNKPDVEIVNGVKVKRLWSLSFPFFSSIKFSPGLVDAILETPADVIHAHGYATPHSFFAGLASSIKRTPFVFTMHGYHRFNFGLGWLFHTIYNTFFAPVFFSWPKRIITVAKATVPYIKDKIPNNRIEVIPNGIDPKKMRHINARNLRNKLTNGEGPLITYIGRLDKYKGVDLLIKAFANLKEKYPSAKLLIAGRDEGVGNDLKKLSNSLGISPIFTLFPSEKMPEVYSASDIIVLPSYYEGLSLVVLGSIACETPILTTPTGDSKRILTEVYGKAADDFIFAVGDSKELYIKLLNMIEKKENYKRLLKTGRKRLIKNYSWESIAKKTVAVYEKVIQEYKK